MSSANARFVSRASAPLTKDELAVKRALFAQRFTAEKDVQVVDRLRGVYMKSNGNGALFDEKDDSRLAPPQPIIERRRLLDEETIRKHLGDDYLAAGWTGPHILKESNIVTAVYLENHGGWNFTTSAAIGAWNAFSKHGEARQSIGQDFDIALANTAFKSSDGLAESGVLNKEYVYFFDVTTTDLTKVAACHAVPEAVLFRVVKRDTGETVMEISGEVLNLQLISIVVGQDGKPVTDLAAIVRDVVALEAPFSDGVGVYYMNTKTGKRLEFVNDKYDYLFSRVSSGASLNTMYLSSVSALRHDLEQIFPEKRESFREYQSDFDKLVELLYRGNTRSAPYFNGKAMQNLLKQTKGCITRDEIALFLIESVSGLKNYIKTVRRMSK